MDGKPGNSCITENIASALRMRGLVASKAKMNDRKEDGKKPKKQGKSEPLKNIFSISEPSAEAPFRPESQGAHCFGADFCPGRASRQSLTFPDMREAQTSTG